MTISYFLITVTFSKNVKAYTSWKQRFYLYHHVQYNCSLPAKAVLIKNKMEHIICTESEGIIRKSENSVGFCISARIWQNMWKWENSVLGFKNRHLEFIQQTSTRSTAERYWKMLGIVKHIICTLIYYSPVQLNLTNASFCFLNTWQNL